MLFSRYETVAKSDVSKLPFEAIGNRQDLRGWLFMPFWFAFAGLDAATPKAAEHAMSQTVTVLSGAKDLLLLRGWEGYRRGIASC